LRAEDDDLNIGIVSKLALILGALSQRLETIRTEHFEPRELAGRSSIH
jgi:hypothetical protein